MSHPRAKSRPSHSEFIDCRGLRLHLRHWSGNSTSPLKIYLHGWLDVSATWQPVVDALPADWNIIAPDQRGFGLSEAAGDTYWFYDYLADLDQILNHLAPGQAIDLLGHSMGSQVAALYAGLRPQRIRRLVVMDGFFLPVQSPDRAVMKIRHWLDDIDQTPQSKMYESLEDLAAKISQRNPRVDADMALDIARAWTRQEDDGRYRLLGDPRHRQQGPLLYRDEEAKAMFAQIQAPTLVLDGADSHMQNMGTQELRQQRLDCIKDRRIQELPDCGHMLHFDAPAATAQAIQDFLSA